ncbi:Gustatory receptor 25 [Hyalella azteca]|uniref:Gustatory receptor 25 n=1 Tax=Hyalella azteca TaxID=294128 RepID=A0A6A0HDY2_HYAAZ|nr:Gustatory receptor 25 [Hyalella azteca]
MITLKSFFMLQLHFLRANMCLPYRFTSSPGKPTDVKLQFSPFMQRASVVGVCICCCISLTSILETFTVTKLRSIQNLISLLVLLIYRLGYVVIIMHLVFKRRNLEEITNRLLKVISPQQTLTMTATGLYLIIIIPSLFCVFIACPMLIRARQPVKWYKYPIVINRDFLYPLCVIYFNITLHILSNFIARKTVQVFFSTAKMRRSRIIKYKSLDHLKTRLRCMKNIQLDDSQTNSIIAGLELVERALNNLLKCFRLPIATMVATDMVEIVYSAAYIAGGNHLWGSWPYLVASIVRISINLSSPAQFNTAVHQVREALLIIERRVNQSSKLELAKALEIIDMLPSFSCYGLFTLGPHAFLPLLSTCITFALVSFQDMKDRAT